MAHRYGLLPSEILERATTFDLVVLDTSARYQNYLYDKQAGNSPKDNIPSQEQMIHMIRQARGEI